MLRGKHYQVDVLSVSGIWLGCAAKISAVQANKVVVHFCRTDDFLIEADIHCGHAMGFLSRDRQRRLPGGRVILLPRGPVWIGVLV
jgi:hypothetical protein